MKKSKRVLLILEVETTQPTRVLKKIRTIEVDGVISPVLQAQANVIRNENAPAKSSD